MKTTIKTKELLKIINPIIEGVPYKNQLIKIDMDLLRTYVEQPKSNNVYDNVGSDDITSLHKNLALYIINASATPKFVTIDLNASNPIQKGMFELIKNIYEEEEFAYLDLNNEGDNQLFIKSKKLKEIEGPTIENASDTFLADSTTVFVEVEPTKPLALIVGAQDVYSNVDFVLEKIKEIPTDKEITAFTSSFFKIIGMADKKVTESEEFKLGLLKLGNIKLGNKNLATILTGNKHSDKISIDFTSEPYHNFLMEQVKEKKFTYLEMLFVTYNNEKRQHENSYSKRQTEFKSSINVDFKSLINQEETVNHLINKYSSDSNLASFSLVQCYHFLEDTYKLREDVISKYLKCIIHSSRDSETINHNFLFQLPITLLNDDKIAVRIKDSVHFRELQAHFKKNNVEPTVWKNTEFILTQGRGFQSGRLSFWVSTFVDEHEITKSFLTKLITINSNFYKEVQNNTFYKNFRNDLELMMFAVKSGMSIKEIKLENISEHLIKDGTKEEEDFKIEYLIAQRDMCYYSKRYATKEETAIYKNKFIKPEYLYLNSDSYFHHQKERAKTLTKIKKLPEIMEVLDKMYNNNFNSVIDVSSFYKDLNPTLKNNKKIVYRLLELGSLSFDSLTERLKCSSDMAIAFINRSTSSVSSIPIQLFNDVNFALAFAKLMDDGIYQYEQRLIPPFVLKFFDNHGVKENFHDYLSRYIAVKDLSEGLVTDQQEVKPTPKRIKV